MQKLQASCFDLYRKKILTFVHELKLGSDLIVMMLKKVNLLRMVSVLMMSPDLIGEYAIIETVLKSQKRQVNHFNHLNVMNGKYLAKPSFFLSSAFIDHHILKDILSLRVLS